MKKLFFLLFLAFSLSVSASTERVIIQGSVGRLFAVIQRPDNVTGKKVPMAILCHGFTGQKEGKLFDAIAESLDKAGIATLRFDFNGHGESDGSFSRMTVLNEIEDAKLVYEYVSKLPYVSTVAMVGHSQGGVVTAMTAAQLGHKKIKAEVLLAPAGVIRDDALRGILFGKQYNPYDLPDSAQVYGPYWLGAEYVHVAQKLPIYETSSQYKGRACVIHGTHDTVVPYTYGQRFSYEIKHSEIHLIEGTDHGFTSHETEVAVITANFLRRVL